ncbi:N-6 DNA methylase [Arthrobacter sp. H5]|uniref:N-6 DNA methylase n=1 Tax=Arthrobacter sp. H5 TaxID=1267973 RepID=UPI0004B7C8D2|nr:N-6 DNA methylase [Arthrobacter sp. H5]
MLEELAARIARRDATRSEATLQADIRSFILEAQLNLDANDLTEDPVSVDMESQLRDGSRNRIDIEAGTAVIEVKKNLRAGNTLAVAEGQLGRYVSTRCAQTGTRYLGVLTDGAEWMLYVPSTDDSEAIVKAGPTFTLRNGADASSLRIWLGSVLATAERIRPTPEEIEARLGATSPAHHADHATLKALLQAGRDNPTVVLKRELWSKLLRTAFGEAFQNAEHLFLDHTLLVLSAEAIAHAVVGFDLSDEAAVPPREMAEGTLFSRSQIHGVVEADFFDWPLEIEGGAAFVRSLTARIGKFDWSAVEHDVLKHLYESVISQETREALGEYYTPDWLADRVIDAEYTNPLETTVMDASAGSGTFVFHAVRRYLEAAESGGVSPGRAVEDVVRHVYGMDIHPVAVTLARVTYLLAIGRERLQHPDRGEIGVPVYLGDSLQWEQQRNLLSREDAITIPTTGDEILSAGGGLLFGDDLIFPASVLKDAQVFDRLVSEMADTVLRSAEGERTPSQQMRRRQSQSTTSYVRSLVDPILTRHSVPEEDKETLRATFTTLRQLHLNGRNHIWGYYVRNLIRPLWLSMQENRVDLLVGNPPWLRYSKMPQSMQNRYKYLAKERNLLSGSLGASARDLSTLFVTRAVELYLKPNGRFAYVMPHGTLSRRPHHGFRTGQWERGTRATAGLAVQFDQAWELIQIRTGFPATSCVIFGQRNDTNGAALPSQTINWIGRFTNPAQTWEQIAARTRTENGSITQHDPDDPAPISPYAHKFRQGALVLPRMLVCVEIVNSGPLGAGAGRVALRSRRGNLDKKPWKDLPDGEATVREEYVHPTYLGEHAVPYRLLEPLKAVLPIKDETLLNRSAIAALPDIESWWGKAETQWAANAKPGSGYLCDRIDFHGQLTAQLETAHSARVVYPKSGNRLTAAIVTDPRAIIDHSLYWAATNSIQEAHYLTAILNSTVLLDRVRPLQTLGLFGARHFDKYVFHVPFPAYSPTNPDHTALAALAEMAMLVAETVDVSEARTFQIARRLIDQALKFNGVFNEIEAAVDRVLPVVIAEEFE